MKNFAEKTGQSRTNISYIHVGALKKLRSLWKAAMKEKYNLLEFEIIERAVTGDSIAMFQALHDISGKAKRRCQLCLSR